MSQELIRSILNHRSIRQYKSEPIPLKDQEILCQVAQSVPTSIHSQAYSIILVEDEKLRKQLAQLSGDQKYVETASLFFVIVMDFYRSDEALKIHGKEQLIHQGIEGILSGTLDSGIVLGTLVAAAEALGYGTVPIGGIRREPEKVIELLGLPPKTFPMVGLCVGIPDEESAKKPRLPQKAVIFKDHYQEDAQLQAIKDFDEVSKDFNKRVRGLDKSWSESLASVYSTIYYPKVYEAMKKQGFTANQ